MGQLTLAFLGNPIVHFDGQRLAFPTRQTLALLIYLAVAGDTHHRDKLATLFWPQYDPGQGRAVLRTTLARLRKALGADDRYLIITPNTLGFNFTSPFELDLHILQSATQVMQVGGPPSAILQQAVNLYHGDFLEGFSLPNTPDFDDWVTFQRETWHYRVGLVFDRLSQWQAEAGEAKSAIETARRWIAHHPFDESAHRRLMQLYFAAGDRGAALQAYEACRAILQQELNLTPGPETEALAKRIRSHDFRSENMDFGSEPVNPKSEIHPRLTGSSKWTDLPLVGRATEHTQLVAAYHAAGRGLTQAMALVGEAGIGKTRLAIEFQRWAIAQGADILQGRAFETGGRLPYQPIVQALRPRLEQENAPDDLLADVWLTELSRLLPELWDRYPDLPAPSGEDAAAQGRLFEAVTRLVAALAQRKPLVFFIDDIQWADIASLDLLQYAASHWADNEAPLLLLLSLRQEALHRGSTQIAPALLDWLAKLQRDLPLTRLFLEPLTAEDTLRLVEMLGGVEQESRGDLVSQAPLLPSLPARFGQWLFGETGGQPFFMAETFKVLSERRLLVAHSLESGEKVWDFAAVMVWLETNQASTLIPPGVQALIRSRLASLTPVAFAFLAAGAVLGQNLEFSCLCHIAGLSEDEGLRALDELLPSHLLRPVAQRGQEARPTDHFYIFSHDKIRDVVYAEAGDTRRVIFHRRAFEVLQAAHAAPATLAYHAHHAGLVEAAFSFSLTAGDEAIRLFAVRDAIVHYEQARMLGSSDLLTNSSKPEAQNLELETQMGHLYLQLGRAYELDNQFEQAQAAYEVMLAFAQASHQPGLECEALTRLASVALLGKIDLDRAITLLHQAQQVAEGSGNKAGLAEIEWNLAQINFYGLNAKATLGHAERALALARELGLPDLMARSLNVIAYGELMLGQWPDTERHAQEGQALFAALGNRAMEVDCMCQVTVARINNGRPQAGVRVGRAARAISLEIENSWGQINSAIQLAPGLLDIGEYGEALTIARQAVTLAQTHTIHMLPMCLIRLGSVYRALLDLDAAHATLLEAKAANENITPRPFTATIAAELCVVRALAGAWIEAQLNAEQVWLTKERSLLYTGFTCYFEIEAFLRAGDMTKAEEHLHYFSQRAVNNPRLQLAYLRALAVQAQWKGGKGQVIDYLERANALAEEIGLPGEQWQILAALGELYQSSDNEASTRPKGRLRTEALGQAAKIVQTLAAKIDDESLRVGFLAAISIPV